MNMHAFDKQIGSQGFQYGSSGLMGSYDTNETFLHRLFELWLYQCQYDTPVSECKEFRSRPPE
jgi:hypothetical protein